MLTVYKYANCLNVCCRMDLCYEKSSVLHERLTIGRAQLEDPANFVYTVEGTNAYGTEYNLYLTAY